MSALDEPMRVPPNALDLEREVLCAGMLESSALDRCDMLDAEHFYSEANAEVWRSFGRIRARGDVVDMVTVRDDLVRVGRLAAVGGDEFIFAITNRLASVEMAPRHAAEIRDLWQRRRVISECMEIASRGYDRGIPTREFLDDAEGRIFRATATTSAEPGLSRMRPDVILQRVQDVALGKVTTMGLTTGVGSLDRRIRGARRGKLIVVAGRPGMGKTSFVGGMARCAALESRKLVAVFQQEMPAEEHDDRYMSLASGVSGTAIQNGAIRDRDVPKLTKAALEMDRSTLLRDDSPRITLAKIKSRVRRALSETKLELGMVVIDHLGLMKWSGKRPREMSRSEELGEYTSSLKELAKEWDVPIVLVAQLNRDCEKRGGDMRPQMSDLGESGKIEQDADQIIFLYRRGYYAEQIKSGRMKIQRWGKAPSADEIQAGDDDGKVELIVAKCRDGAPGPCMARWEPECTRIVDLEYDDYRPEATVRGLPDYVGGSPDDGSGDGEPFPDDREWNP